VKVDLLQMQLGSGDAVEYVYLVRSDVSGIAPITARLGLSKVGKTWLVSSSSRRRSQGSKGWARLLVAPRMLQAVAPRDPPLQDSREDGGDVIQAIVTASGAKTGTQLLDGNSHPMDQG